MRKVYTKPAAEPITLAEAKLYLKVDGIDEDGLIFALLKASRELAEKHTNRTLITTVWEVTLDEFPDDEDDPCIELYGCPVNSITHVKYYDTAGVQQTVAATVYLLDSSSEPARVALKLSQCWPATDERPGGISIRYSAGYGATGSTVPSTIKTAMMLILGHLYENRQSVAIGSFNEIPMGANYLLDRYRVY